ncbi:hypothetical protein BV25DRAFT_625159 [Artomyces pyxidatus]|uniref:Uncharacterized protein n=1 Tax=Artomyces pyxidatus TaxID=48021 RepID=A0ACB8T1Q1_9AGAM|nr:hypothetical protein BV25DRAFT_625159 [Artomyces pyxidatus]
MPPAKTVFNQREMDDASFGRLGSPLIPGRALNDTAGSLCATTRLLQCDALGIYNCDLSRKFLGVEGTPASTPDIQSLEHFIRRSVVKQVADWTAANRRSEVVREGQWIPILYNYHLVTSPIHGGHRSDRGHLVFTDLTLTRFLLVMCFTSKSASDRCDCGQPIDHVYEAKYQADRLMSLLKSMYHAAHAPRWVRSTYVKPGSMTLPSTFFDFHAVPPTNVKPQIYHVTPENFVPTLLVEDVEVMMHKIVVSGLPNPPSEEVWSRLMRTGSPVANPGTDYRLSCAYCRKEETTKLRRCSRCKSVYYCDENCQKMGWPAHKSRCKGTQRDRQSEEDMVAVD